MKILEDRTTPNSRRTRLFLGEKELRPPYEDVQANGKVLPDDEAEQSPPVPLTPTLVLENGVTIEGCSAVCRYLEEFEPVPPLLGWDPIDKAMVEKWLRILELSLFDIVYQDSIRVIPAWGELYRGKAEESFQTLDSYLEDHKYFAGKNFSFADITAYVAIEALEEQKVTPASELLFLHKWRNRIAERSSLYATNHEVAICSA